MLRTKRGKTDPRVIRTKRMLKEALLSLLEENPNPGRLTVQTIAERAELNRATFYLHYRDLEDLIEQMVDEVLQALVGKIYPTPGEGPSIGNAALVAFLEHIYQHAALFHVMIENKDFRSRLFGMLSEIIAIKRGGSQAKGREQVPRDIVAASSLGVVMWWIQEGMPYSPTYLASQILLMYRKNRNAD